MTVGSLFSGCGGFDLGFEQAGYSAHWRCEIEPFCRSVLTAKMPGPEIFEDVRDVRIPPVVDVIIGGFPCQDVSVAGQRRGLAGARSGLFFEFMRIVGERRPAWVVIENVPGLLSSHDGRDFATVLHALAERGYGWAYRVLDSRYFGVPQRRRRVFIVGCLGGQFERAAAVFPESARREGHPQTCDEAGQDIAATLRGRSHGAGVNMPGRGGEDDENIVAFNWQSGGDTRYGFGDQTTALSCEQTPAIFATLNSGGNDGGFRTEPGEHLIATAITASAGHHGHSSPRGDGSDNLIATLRAHKQSEDDHNVVAHCLTGTMHKRHDEDTDTLIPAGGVRRLTPLECERLQGFPDFWTCLCGAQSTAACRCPDSPRYRALGNAVTVPVARWIARRLIDVARSA